MTQHRETTPSNQVAEIFIVCDHRTPSKGFWQLLVHGRDIRCRNDLLLRGTPQEVYAKARRVGWYVSDDGELSYCPIHRYPPLPRKP